MIPTRRGFLAGLGALAFGPPAWGATPLLVATSTAMSGPSAQLGRAVVRGLRAAFEGASVAGRPVELLVLDDGYRKDLAKHNMQQLCERQEVIAVVGNLGTPTAMVTHALAESHGVVLFGAVTGADVLREPDLRWVWNVRASYREELAVSVGGLLKRGVRAGEFAFFGQADGYGDAVRQGANELLGLEIPGGTYTRNTLDVADAVRTLWELRPVPRVVVLGGTYLPTAKFLRILRPQMPKTLFVNVSFVGSDPLVSALGEEDAEGLVVTQVVPPPFDSELPVAVEFMERFPDKGQHGPLAFEGYVTGLLLLSALGRAAATGRLDRAGLRDTLEDRMEFDLDLGTPLRFDSADRQASHRVWPTILRGGEPVHLDVEQLEL